MSVECPSIARTLVAIKVIRTDLTAHTPKGTHVQQGNIPTQSYYTTQAMGPAEAGTGRRALRSIGAIAVLCGMVLSAHSAFASGNGGHPSVKPSSHRAAPVLAASSGTAGTKAAKSDGEESSNKKSDDHESKTVSATAKPKTSEKPEATSGPKATPCAKDDGKKDDKDKKDDDKDKGKPQPTAKPTPKPTVAPTPTGGTQAVVSVIPTPDAAVVTVGQVQAAATTVPNTGSAPHMGGGIALFLAGILMLIGARFGRTAPRRTNWEHWA